MNPDTQTAGGGRFPATRWSVVEAARSLEPGERERALEILFAAYWRPIYKYVRLRWRRPPADAQDLTQAFFMELLERGLLSKFDPAKSRLRTYLRICMDSFAANMEKAAHRQKRGGNSLHVALDFAAAESELKAGAVDPAALPSPESLEEFFEREWVRSLFGLAVEELRKMCEARGKLTAFQLFEKYDLDGEENISYAELAETFEMPVTDVTNALAWARREFRRIALERLQEICGSEEEFRREARAVFGVTPK